MRTYSNDLPPFDVIICPPSPDGVLAAAALQRHAVARCLILFSPPRDLHYLCPQKWGKACRVLLVGFAVTGAGRPMASTPAVLMLKAIQQAGHTVVGIIDDHDSERWEEAFALANADFNALAIKPSSAGKRQWLGSLVLEVLGGDCADDHTHWLCRTGTDPETDELPDSLWTILHRAIKSSASDYVRRVSLALHYAVNSEPNDKILEWVQQYLRVVLGNHAQLMAEGKELGDGIVRLFNTNMRIDLSILMQPLIHLGYVVAVLDAGLRSGEKTIWLAGPLDIQEEIKIVLNRQRLLLQLDGSSRMPPTVLAEHENRAVALVRRLLQTKQAEALNRPPEERFYPGKTS